MQTTIKVTGMTCGHCVAAVTKSLSKVSGVDQTEVSLETGQAVVTGNTDPSALLAAIKDAGYEGTVK